MDSLAGGSDGVLPVQKNHVPDLSFKVAEDVKFRDGNRGHELSSLEEKRRNRTRGGGEKIRR
jgi:hypothetical protein